MYMVVWREQVMCGVLCEINSLKCSDAYMSDHLMIQPHGDLAPFTVKETHKNLSVTVHLIQTFVICFMQVPVSLYTIEIHCLGCWEDKKDGDRYNYLYLQNNVAHIFLTHWGRVTHLCVGNLTTIGSDNGLSPGRRQAITWTNVGILLIGPLGTNFKEILIGIHTFSFKKIHLKMLSGKWRPFCLGLNVLTIWYAHCFQVSWH